MKILAAIILLLFPALLLTLCAPKTPLQTDKGLYPPGTNFSNNHYTMLDNRFFETIEACKSQVEIDISEYRKKYPEAELEDISADIRKRVSGALIAEGQEGDLSGKHIYVVGFPYSGDDNIMMTCASHKNGKIVYTKVRNNKWRVFLKD